MASTSAYPILYMGLPLGALALLHDGHDVRVACISRVQSPGMRRLRRQMLDRGALVLGRPDLSDPAILDLLRGERAALLVSWFWTRKIPPEALSSARRAFGVHPSLLPKYRGPDPFFWAIAAGEKDTGVTAHVLTPQYDEGSILAQRRVPIPKECNAWDLARALDRPSLAMMREVAGRYARGENIPEIPQDNERASEAPSPSDEDCELVWDWPVEDVLSRIRAASPDPGAYTGYNDQTIVILRAEPCRNVPLALEPGDVVSTDEGVIVRAADGGVLLLEARHEDHESSVKGMAIASLFPGIPHV
ncbi:MAG: formyltransferase family protein [Deltaproteobacteria bacterium]|nr:formyltransferase family protein [Deltaproteobacteria bacterium]